jgi:hypothetical protein
VHAGTAGEGKGREGKEEGEGEGREQTSIMQRNM